jgi:enoyl-CoA hydratase/carnithine racemase
MSEVRFERAGAVGRLVLDRPPQNRMGKQLVLDLTQAIHEAATSDIRVPLVRGAGPDFFDNVGGSSWR